MSAEIMAAWIGVAASIGLAIIGWIFAGLANSRAKEANMLATEANSHASAAVSQAEHANRVAEAANQLSEESNRIVERDSAQRVEQWLTEWTVEWDPESALVILTNEGRDPAHSPTVILNGQELRDSWVGQQSVSRGEELRLAYPHLITRRSEENARLSAEWHSGLKAGVLGNIESWGETVPVIITWHTGLGQPREQRLALVIE